MPLPDQLHILGVCGSLRTASYNRGLLRAEIELAPPDMTIDTFEHLARIPPYNGDDDGDDLHESVMAFKDARRKADGVSFVTPEYNYSVPGQLKNAIDWASRGGVHSPLRGWVRALSVR